MTGKKRHPVDVALDIAEREFLNLRDNAEAMAMPSDPQGLLDEAQTQFETLPKDEPERAVLLKCVKRTRHALEAGDELQFKISLLRLRMDWENLRAGLALDKAKRAREKRSQGGEESGKKKKEERAARVAEAKRLWALYDHIEPQFRTSAVARTMGLTYKAVYRYLNEK